jgi:type VI secretion system secreted protein Hcp
VKFQFPARTASLCLGLVFAVASTGFADSFYLKIKAQKQGDIKGGVTQKGRENSILVTSISHSIVSPRDPQSGLPTGQRQHKPLTVTIPLDRSAPLLYSALVTNENLPQANLFFWTTALRPTSIASEVQQYTIRLTNANISSIEEITQTDAAGANPKPAIKVTFTYQKIEWTWNDGGITAMDDWESRY